MHMKVVFLLINMKVVFLLVGAFLLVLAVFNWHGCWATGTTWTRAASPRGSLCTSS